VCRNKHLTLSPVVRDVEVAIEGRKASHDWVTIGMHTQCYGNGVLVRVTQDTISLRVGQ
jgi:hypothetical protein